MDPATTEPCQGCSQGCPTGAVMVPRGSLCGQCQSILDEEQRQKEEDDAQYAEEQRCRNEEEMAAFDTYERTR